MKTRKVRGGRKDGDGERKRKQVMYVLGEEKNRSGKRGHESGMQVVVLGGIRKGRTLKKKKKDIGKLIYAQDTFPPPLLPIARKGTDGSEKMATTSVSILHKARETNED